MYITFCHYVFVVQGLAVSLFLCLLVTATLLLQPFGQFASKTFVKHLLGGPLSFLIKVLTFTIQLCIVGVYFGSIIRVVEAACTNRGAT